MNRYDMALGKQKQDKDEIDILEYIETNLKVSRRDAIRYYGQLPTEVKLELRKQLEEPSFEKTKLSTKKTSSRAKV